MLPDSDPSSPRISARDLTFSYPGKTVLGWRRGRLRAIRRPDKVVMQDVNFEAWDGDVVGIVGQNGSGKSTLIRLLAGILNPDCGYVSVKGSISPLAELGAGFDLEMSVRDNVALYGALLGRSVSEMRMVTPRILEWAGLTSLDEWPLHTLSTGMKARLAFAVATEIGSEVLLIDEVFSVGDGSFREKSKQRLRNLLAADGVTLVVSHDMDLIREMCNRCLWLLNGRIAQDGDPLQVTTRYMHFLRDLT